MVGNGDGQKPDSPFDAMAPSYERWADPLTTAFAAVALDQMSLAKGMRLLDVGAGAGGPAVLAAARGCEVAALDIAPAFVRRLRQRLAPFAASRVEAMDVRSLDGRFPPFDAALSILCVTLLENALDCCRRMVGATRPGGSIGLVHWATEFGGPQFQILGKALLSMGEPDDMSIRPGVARLQSPEEMEGLLAGAGCGQIKVVPVKAFCALPEPSRFLDELGLWFTRMPLYRDLTESKKEELSSHIERAYRGAHHDGETYVMPATVHVATGIVDGRSVA